MFGVILFILYVVLLGVLFIGAWRLRYAYRHFRMKRSMSPVDLKAHIPSVTVCIPARNEDHALTDCLQRVVSSTYEKLEIIVLDDRSRDNTPALIKSFASEGVRFVEGASLPADWLGKNHALQELLEEASGSYVLFMDVDTRIEPYSIEQLVAYAQKENALMVSVLPRREDGWRSSVIFSTLRYFWEIMFHRKSAPATASNAWLIHRRTLVDAFHGFTHYKQAIQPESKFSARLMKAGRYRFLIGTRELGISYEKKWRSQIDTSIRLLFPLLGARIEHAIIASLDLLIISSPLFIILSGFIVGWSFHHIALGIFWLLLAALYAFYLRLVWNRGWWLGALLWPFIAIQEVIILAMSTREYSNKRVTWKGRTVKVL
jgi:glycosyltransferase involved in cell wall biosynthesis